MATKDIVVIYHADCTDGFGAAYAAWMKLGDSAQYVPVQTHDVLPEGLDGKEVYIVDFSYPAQMLLELELRVNKLVVLDHHIGAKEDVESIREHIFDNNRSGATITWAHFFPDVPVPKLLQYVEDGDIWRHSLPNWKEVGTFLSTIPFDFGAWDQLAKDFEDVDTFSNMVAKGAAYSEYYDFIIQNLASRAELVEFDGHKILAVNAPRFFRSELGHVLAKRQSPFAIVWYAHGNKWHLSLRGDGSINLPEIAKRFGGSGHKNASAIDIPLGDPLPFTKVSNE